LLALTLTLIFSLQVKATSSPTFKWSPQVAFKLPATNTIVKFADWAYFSSIEWDKWQASKITFNNLLVGSGSALSSLCLSSPNTDITILSANSESVKLNLAETDSTLQVWNLDVKTVRIGGSYFTKDDFFVSYNEWQACSQDCVFQNETLTAIKAVSSTTVTLGLTSPTPTLWIQGEGKNATWYFRADMHTVYDVYGYKLADSPSESSYIDAVSASGAYVSYYGVRVWVVHSDGSICELTDGEPAAIVSRNENGEGLQSATWTCPEYNNLVEALMVKVYHRFGPGEWSLRATFITENQTLIKLPEATWTFHYYTVRSCNGETTTSKLCWGGSYNSKVDYVYVEPNIWDLMKYKLNSGDFIGFLIMPYTNLVGNLFYGFMLLLVCVPLYNRYRSVNVILFTLILLSGADIGLGLLIPAVASPLAYIILLISLAALIYRALR